MDIRVVLRVEMRSSVVIIELCGIGDNVKLYHGVTLGTRSFAKDGEAHIIKGGKRHLDVQDNVTIFPKSTILGSETIIEANSTIWANVFLLESEPPNSLVIYEESNSVFSTSKLAGFPTPWSGRSSKIRPGDLSVLSQWAESIFSKALSEGKPPG